MAESDSMAIISKQTLVPLGAVLACAIVLFGLVLAANNRLLAIEYSVQDLKQEVQDMRSNFQGMTGDRWTSSDMAHWAELLRVQNKDLVVPEPTPAWRRK